MTHSLATVGRIGRNTLLAGIALLIGAAGTAVAQGGYGGGMMNDGWGMFGGWGFLWLLLLIGIVALLVSLVGGGDGGNSRSGDRPDRALAELRERYARGEISDEEFEERRHKLRETR